MSKGSTKDDINVAYLEKLTSAVMDATEAMSKISESYGSNGVLEKTISELAKAVNAGNMSTKQLLKEAANTQKNIRSVEYGLSDTDKYNKTVSMFIKLLEEKMGNSTIDDVLVKKLTTAFENLDVTAILESEKVNQRGEKGALLKNVTDNSKLNKVNEDLAKKLGIKLDSVQYKLMSFFQDMETRREKKTVGFIDDLIEGLGQSKWVGGTLRDTFKLVGLLGANFLAQFGKFGRILGGAFYVAMETAGPLLTRLLLQGMGKLFSGILSGKVFGKLISKLPGNSPLGNVVSAFSKGNVAGEVAGSAAGRAAGEVAGGALGKAPIGKAAALKGLIGPGLVATAAFAGGGWAMGQAKDSWDKGKKGNAAAFGIGGAALIGGGIAALVAGITAPITAPLLAIGAAVVGLAFLWKKFGGNIQEHFKKNKEFYNKVLDILGFFMPVFGILRNAINWWLDLKGYFDNSNVEGAEGNRNSAIQKVANFVGHQDKKVDQTFSFMDGDKKIEYSVNKAGGIIGLEKFDKRTASKIASHYFANHSDQAENMYELVGSEYARLGSFNTDWAIYDKNGRAMQAILHKGASKEMKGLREFLSTKIGNNNNSNFGSGQKAQDLINSLGYTSGRSTDSSIHAKPKWGNDGLNTHQNIAAMVTDMGTGDRWSDEQWKEALPYIQEYMRALGYRVQFEGYDKNGKRDIGEQFKSDLTNRHLHIDLITGAENAVHKDAKKNEAASKVRAVNKTEELIKIAQQHEPDTYEIMTYDYYGGMSKKDREDLLKKAMEAKGYKFDDNNQVWTKVTKDWLQRETGVKYVVPDSSGNYKFEEMMTKMGNVEAGSSNN